LSKLARSEPAKIAARAGFWEDLRRFALENGPFATFLRDSGARNPFGFFGQIYLERLSALFSTKAGTGGW
jgi:hypothetical protein